MRAVILVCSALLLSTGFPNPVFAQQKTVKACQEEWRANKAANQAQGVTEKAYVAQCRAGGAAPGSNTAATPAPQPAAPAAAPTTRMAPAPKPAATTTAPTGANEFSSEAQAKARCPAATVVWANLSSKVYHFAGSKNYGNTKKGAFMCEQDAQTAGVRAAKNEKHP